jgi:glycosyltransferase involved in cell wall biosynthesis
MKIGTIITSFFPGTAYGGPINSTLQRVTELTKLGHEVTVLTSNILDPKDSNRISPGTEVHENGFKIIRFSSHCMAKHWSGIFSISMIFWLFRHKDEFDLFHISFPREIIPLTTCSLLLLSGKKVVLQTHGMLDRRDFPRNFLDSLISKALLDNATGVIVLQEYERKTIEIIASKAKIHIVPNGIDITNQMPNWTGFKNEKPTVLFLARLHPRKRVLDFIYAAQIVLKSNRDINFRIVGPDGGDEIMAKQLVNDLNLGQNFDFIGPISRDEALQEYASANIYVLPSVNEPFATTITEALSVGVPVLVTNTVHNLELLVKYDAVEVVNPGSQFLSQGIEKILLDPVLCKKRSTNGKKLVEDELIISKTIKKVLKVYNS